MFLAVVTHLVLQARWEVYEGLNIVLDVQMVLNQNKSFDAVYYLMMWFRLVCQGVQIPHKCPFLHSSQSSWTWEPAFIMYILSCKRKIALIFWQLFVFHLCFGLERFPVKATDMQKLWLNWAHQIYMLINEFLSTLEVKRRFKHSLNAPEEKMIH